MELHNLSSQILARASWNPNTSQLHVETLKPLPSQLLLDFTRFARQTLPTPPSPINATHDFAVVNQSTLDLHQAIMLPLPHSVQVDHRIMHCLGHSLALIPVHHLHSTARSHGLDLYGANLLTHEGARCLAATMEYWATMLTQGPPKLRLYDGMVNPWSDDGSEGGCWYYEDASPEPIELDRDNAVGMLKAVTELAKQMETLDDNHFIVHQGI